MRSCTNFFSAVHFIELAEYDFKKSSMVEVMSEKTEKNNHQHFL